jgi:FG-GAP-like repeat/FG-GAP repeat
MHLFRWLWLLVMAVGALATCSPRRVMQSEDANFAWLNPSGDLRVSVAGDGATVSVLGDPAPVRLSLAAWGRSGALASAAAPMARGGQDHAELVHTGLVEWWEPHSDGFEHGFTVTAPPVGAGPLVLEIGVDQAQVAMDDGGASATFSRPGSRDLYYRELKAWDASGRVLTSWMEPTPSGLRLLVDDSDAHGVITVDPLLTSVWTAEPDAANEYLGYSVASAGDVDGDGYADVLVGAVGFDGVATDSGRAQLYLGAAAGLTTTAAWTAESDQSYSNFGASVASAGDVNGDGYPDVLVGSANYDASATNEGRAFLYLGSATGPASTAAWTAESGQVGALLGWSVGSAGDVNADGFSDVIVGAHGYDNGEFDEGRAYVFLGSAAGLETTAAWTAESDQAIASFGLSVASAGDVDADGYDDVLVGAYGYDSGELDEGRAYLFLGAPAGVDSAPAWTADSNHASAYFGYDVAGAGDVDADGYDDVLVGAYGYDGGETDEGRAYLFLGSAAGLEPTPAWTAESDQASAYFSYALASAGDVDADGHSDVVVGAFTYDDGETDEGQAYLFRGTPDGLEADPVWTAASDQSSAYFGLSVAGAGDVDGDGFGEILVGAPYYDGGSTDKGRAYLYRCSDADADTLCDLTDPCVDPDTDGLCDDVDLCPLDADPTNADLDLDGAGDACDPCVDIDADGLCAPADLCPDDPDPSNTDLDLDGIGDACDPCIDPDADGVCDPADLCPGVPDPTNADDDLDGIGDACDGCVDVDADGLCAGSDLCPDDTDPTNADLDLDGIGDACDACVDADLDGLCQGVDLCPDTPDPMNADADLDGVGDPCDPLPDAWTTDGPPFALFGNSVASAGDVNGDGYADLVVGSSYYGAAGEGRIEVFLGSASGTSTVAAWTFESDEFGAHLGWSVASAGDVNGDGYDDVIAGAPFFAASNSVQEGRTYLFLGSATGLETVPAWTFESEVNGAHLGWSVASAGDVDGDGYDDVVLGAPYESVSGSFSYDGRAYLFRGSATGLEATPSWTVSPGQASALFGTSVASAGDVDADGYDDVLVGAVSYSGSVQFAGRAWLYRGSAGGLEASPAWTVDSDQSGSGFGGSVASAGDVDGDGYGDVLVGAYAYGNGENGEGRAYLYHGSATGLETSTAWTVESDQLDGRLGWSVASAGDTDGDGFGDVIVGAWLYDNGDEDEGQARLYRGAASGLSADPSWTAEADESHAWFGYSVAGAGDTNGDGYDDVAVGAPRYGDGDEGRVYLYLGACADIDTDGVCDLIDPCVDPDADGLCAELDPCPFDADATNTDVDLDGIGDVCDDCVDADLDGLCPGVDLCPDDFDATNADVDLDGIGDACDDCLDVDLDGLCPGPDLCPDDFDPTNADVDLDGIGDACDACVDADLDGLCPGVDLCPGTLDPTNADADLDGIGDVCDDLPSSWTADFGQISEFFGGSVAPAGDVNGDGLSDLVVGARLYSNGAELEGRALVYYGSVTLMDDSPDWTVESDETAAQFGASVSSAGDVNGDGYDDVVIGAPLFSDSTNLFEGRAYLFLGSPSGLETAPAWTVEADQDQAQLGSSVSTAGDVNGDGYADVVVGAPLASGGSLYEGRAYLYLGSASGLEPAPAWTAEGDQDNASFGWSVSSAGDVNGDGYGDVVVGARSYSGASAYTGRAYVYLGSPAGLDTAAVWTVDSDQSSSNFGFSVASAGDVDGDGYDDVLVGAPYYANGSYAEGRASLYLGSATGVSTSAAWSAESDQDSALLGYSVSPAGDVNADGYADVIVGAYAYDNGSADEGRAFLYLGSASGLETTATWTGESDAESTYYGFSVSSAGDTNGDGYADFVVGAPYFGTAPGLYGGRVYRYLGACSDVDVDSVCDLVDPCVDPDADTLCADIDLCPLDPDPTNADGDWDGIGDVCDACFDPDDDALCGVDDLCPFDADPANTDLDLDGLGDACEDCIDLDGDTVCGNDDLCPLVADATNADVDLDGIGDVCDDCVDIDGDTLCADVDLCPLDADVTNADIDLDGIGDACDSCVDVDGDGLCADVDLCPDDFDPTNADIDLDGIGDVCDAPATLLDAVPGTAGMNNSWTVIDGPASTTVQLWYGTAAGNTAVMGCPGLQLGIKKAKLLKSGSTDASGTATISRFIGAGVAGKTMKVQAVFPSFCFVTNIDDTTF